jgi:DNA replication protein DnaC
LRAEFTKVTSRPQTPPDETETPAIVEAWREAAGLPKAESHQAAEKLASRALADLAFSLGARYSRERTRLAKFEIYHASQETAVTRVRAFIADMGTNLQEGRSLVLYGAVGAGKDHLLAAALYVAASATLPAQWLSGQEFYGRIRDTMDTGEREETVMEKWTRPIILGISDPIPPIGKPSEWNTSQLYRILDRRYRAMRSTWVSLNAESLADADAKLSAPIFDRLRDGATLVPCFWPSFRERAKAVAKIGGPK